MRLDYTTRYAPALLALVGLALDAGCVLTTTEQAECRSNLECRDAFGLGSVCNGDGFCEQEAINPRCTKTYPEDLLASPEKRLEYKDHIVFGSVMQRDVDLFAKFELSAQLAFSQANQRGGVDERELGVIFCSSDGGYDDDLEAGPEAAAEVARYLVDVMSVPAIFGPATSAEAEAVFIAVRDSGTLVVSPSATSPDLIDLDASSPGDSSPGLLWRTAPPDSFQGEAIAHDMRAPGAGRSEPVDTAVVIYIDDPYGSALFNTFATAFEAMGGTAVPRPFVPANSSTPGESLSEVVAKVGLEGGFDEVLFVSSRIEDIVAFLDAAGPISGYDGKGIFLPESAANNDVLGEASTARFSQVRGTRPEPLDRTTDLVYETFLTAYQVAYGEEVEGQIFTANSYDAGWLMAFGAAWALARGDDLTGGTMARGLRKLSSGMSVTVGGSGWITVQQQFAEGKSVDITGASGALDYDPDTEETSTNIEIWRVGAGNTIQAIYTWAP